MHLARQQPRRQAPGCRVIVQVPHELRVGRPRARAEKMHLQTVAVNDVGIEITKPLLQASLVDEGRRRSRQKSCAEAEARSDRPARAPFSQSGQRVREGHRRGVRVCGGFRDERTAGCGDHRERPVGAGLANSSEDVEQRSLRSAELAARAEEDDPHRRRVRTFTWSPGLSTSVCLASIDLRCPFSMRTISMRLFEPFSVMPPAAAIASKTVIPSSWTTP